MTGRALCQGVPRTNGHDLAAWATDTLAAARMCGDGLYVATATAGGWEAVEFWRDARAVGLAFANPRLFPWTLANSPTGAIAQALGIRGPSYTIVGTDDAVDAALAHAAEDLSDALVSTALVVAVDGLHDRFELAAVEVSARSIGRYTVGAMDLRRATKASAVAALAARLDISKSPSLPSAADKDSSPRRSSPVKSRGVV